MAQRIAQVNQERVEVVGEAGGRRGEARSVELGDQRPDPPPSVGSVGRLVERPPVGEADALALSLRELRE